MNLMRAKLIALVVILAAIAVVVTLCMKEPDELPSSEGAVLEELGEGGEIDGVGGLLIKRIKFIKLTNI